jgi:hypothetical protein
MRRTLAGEMFLSLGGVVDGSVGALGLLESPNPSSATGRVPSRQGVDTCGGAVWSVLHGH